MKRLIPLLLVLLLCGCSPQRRLARLLERFPPDTTTQIEYRDTTIWRDTLVTRYLPGEVVRDSFIIVTPKYIVIPDTSITLNTSLATSTAWLEDNVLGLSLQQYDHLFKFLLDSAIRENQDSIIIINNIPYPVVEKAKPFYKNGFFILAGLILAGLILFFAFRK